MNKTLSSPNTIIWEYFKGLRRLVRNINTHTQTEQKQEIALSIFLATTIVEAFLNIYFRIVVDNAPYTQFRVMVLKDLGNRKSLDYKIKTWPKKVFKKNINFDNGIWKKFLDLKDKRNNLMHFTSTHEEIKFENTVILGTSDISLYSNLTLKDAELSLKTAEGILEEIFRCQNTKEEDIPKLMHGWTGKIPAR